MAALGLTSALLLRAAGQACAFPLAQVVETMRPLPLAPLAGAPAVVRGLALIRGLPVPVIDLNQLLDSTRESTPGRFVVLRVQERRLAVAVEAVLGIAQLAADQLTAVPPLLQAANAELLAAIALHDRELLFVLQATRLVPDELWQQLQTGALAS